MEFMPKNMADIARHHGRVIPDKVAFHFEQTETTYLALDQRSNRIANGMASLGVKPQARVAIFSRNHTAFFEIWFACLKSEVVLVPVNARLAGPEVEFVINDSGAEVLFVGNEYRELISGISDRLASVRQVVVIDGDGSGSDYDTWLSTFENRDPGLDPSPDQVAIQMYTSGTTGNPKGVLTQHRGLLALLDKVRSQGHWSHSDVSLICSPLFHIGGSGWAIQGLFFGATAVLLRSFDAVKVLENVRAFGVTKLLLVPSMVKMILDIDGTSPENFSSINYLQYSGAPMPSSLLQTARQTFGCRFAQTFGLTETSGSITWLSPADHESADENRLRSCGRASQGMEIKIVGSDGLELPAGKVGEIVCRGDQVFAGYWNLPSQSAAAIVDGWFHTGDAGYFDEDGYLYISDRIKDMIVSGGENVYPAEVEAAILSHPLISEVAVIGVPDDKWGETVKAVVVTRGDAAITLEEIASHTKALIGSYKCPRSLEVVSALPRNPSGKVLKNKLREMCRESQDRHAG